MYNIYIIYIIYIIHNQHFCFSTELQTPLVRYLGPLGSISGRLSGEVSVLK